MNLKQVRAVVLKNNEYEVANKISEFLARPVDEEIARIISLPLFSDVSESLNDYLNSLYKLYCNNKDEYANKYIYGQKIIWDEILFCAKKITKNSEILQSKTISFITENYSKACNEVKAICEILANSQAEVSRLEDRLGVDRYLDLIAEDDLYYISQIIDLQTKLANDLLSNYKYTFQSKWSLRNIKDVIFHKLIQYNGDNQICSLTSANKKKLIVFVIDGFGLCQYFWNKEIDSDKKFLTYKENIFDWLENQNHIKELVLGSAYISDTAAGLSQIFTGHLNVENGIVSSKLFKDGRVYNTKQTITQDFSQSFDVSKQVVTQIANTLGFDSTILYCSKYDDRHISGFSSHIFKDAKIEQVVPYERVFSVLKNELENVLHFVYLTNIDNSGHTVGAYSKFEKYEHQKINSLLRNFLIELATSNPEIFNGETSIILTADHGMAESSKKMVSWKNISNKFYFSGVTTAKFVEDNRALLIYNLLPDDMILCKKILEDYFTEKNISVDICYLGDSTFDEFFCTGEHISASIMPQIVVRLIDNGLFYSRDTMYDSLMHFGGHGGSSINEAFVPLLDINLDQKLLSSINRRFIEKL